MASTFAFKCNIDPTRLRHLGSGVYSDVFDIVGTPDRVLKLSYYDDAVLEGILRELTAAKKARDPLVKEKHAEKARELLDSDPVTVETKMATITNAIIERGMCPHYVRTFEAKDCLNFYNHLARAHKIPALREAEMRNRRNGDGLQQRYNNVKILERYSSNLTDFIMSNTRKIRDTNVKFKTMKGHHDDVLRIIIFQVMYGLATLQKSIDAFRHNDLSTNNVLIELDNVKVRRAMRRGVGSVPVIKYSSGNLDMYVPDTGVNVAIGDFDFASGGHVKIPGLEHMTLHNKKVRTGGNFDVAYFPDKKKGRVQYHINPTMNDSYDVQYFLSTLDNLVSYATRKTDDVFMPKTRDFLQRRLRNIVSTNRGKAPIESLFPLNILKDSYFNVLRTKPKTSGQKQYAIDGKK